MFNIYFFWMHIVLNIRKCRNAQYLILLNAHCVKYTKASKCSIFISLNLLKNELQVISVCQNSYFQIIDLSSLQRITDDLFSRMEYRYPSWCGIWYWIISVVCYNLPLNKMISLTPGEEQNAKYLFTFERGIIYSSPTYR